MRLRVVKAQGQTFNVAAGAVSLEFLDLGASVPYLASYRSAIKVNPGSRSTQGMEKSFQVNLPGAKFEIEVVLPIVHGGSSRAVARPRWFVFSQNGSCVYEDRQGQTAQMKRRYPFQQAHSFSSPQLSHYSHMLQIR
jgi:hypothetical protein